MFKSARIQDKPLALTRISTVSNLQTDSSMAEARLFLEKLKSQKCFPIRKKSVESIIALEKVKCLLL